MLNTLRKIVQEVNSAKDPKATLGIIVQRVKEAMGTQVCSVCPFDTKAQHFVLMAAENLNKRSIGKVSMAPSEGLVGLVGTREGPLNPEDTTAHPCCRYFVEIGEEHYASFLSVPITHHRRTMGVLVMQQKERRQFDESEEAFLVTMSAQLAGVIVHAEATDSTRGLGKLGKGIQEVEFVGVPGAPKVGVGKAVVVLSPADLEVVPDKQIDDIDAEIALFRQTLEGIRTGTRTLSSKLASRLRKEEHALFDVYLMMLDDASIDNEVKHIIHTDQWAQGALCQVMMGYVQRFELMDDVYLRERASDVKGIGRRLLAYLQRERRQNLTYPEQTIIVNERLSPAMFGEVPEGRLVGLVSVLGSDNSHVAILARAMGIPTVVGAVDLPYSKVDGIDLIVDGYCGKVCTNPPAELVRQYSDVIVEEHELSEGLAALHELPYETLDGRCVSPWVGTGLLTDVARAQERGAEGVGPCRTEMLFIINDRSPSEKEQLAICHEQLSASHLLPMVMYTLDIGDDKALSCFPTKEDSPFLGWRGIRITLDHPEIFLAQTRVMPEASEGLDSLHILLPMISGTHELEEVLYLIHHAWGEVCDEDVDIAMPPTGMMVEIPVAVYQTHELARQVDFLSAGSNGLIQHLLAVDHNSPWAADLCDYLRSATLYALKKVVDDTHLEGKPVSICGEMAGDPTAAASLMATGLDSLSMDAINLPKVKWLLRQITLGKVRNLFGQLLAFDNPQVIHSSLHLALRSLGLGRVINPAATAQP